MSSTRTYRVRPGRSRTGIRATKSALARSTPTITVSLMCSYDAPHRHGRLPRAHMSFAFCSRASAGTGVHSSTRASKLLSLAQSLRASPTALPIKRLAQLQTGIRSRPVQRLLNKVPMPGRRLNFEAISVVSRVNRQTGVGTAPRPPHRQARPAGSTRRDSPSSSHSALRPRGRRRSRTIPRGQRLQPRGEVSNRAARQSGRTAPYAGPSHAASA